MDAPLLLHNKISITCGLVRQEQRRHDQHSCEAYRIKGVRRCDKSCTETRRLHIRHEFFAFCRWET
jgi:hypothetical protein